MKNLFIGIITSTLIIGGCASPMAKKIPYPDIPKDEVSIIEVDLNIKDESNINDNTIQLKGHDIPIGSSVVINVPDNLFEYKSEKSAKKQDFKTKDFFNEAEQQIEKELIRNGFKVLSRSKFEAKLRSLRDEARCNLANINCLYSKVSPDIRPIIDNLKKKLELGLIDEAYYAEQLDKFREKLAISSAGKSRKENEKELTDISEVIRASESGDIQSDYILQINKFDTEVKSEITKSLRSYSKVRSFVRQHNIERSFSKYHIISCSTTEARLNAKLVHVKSGAIAWIGEHSLNEYSAGAQKIKIELGVSKSVSNSNEIKNFIYYNNTDQARIDRHGKDVTHPPYKYQKIFIKPTVSYGKCSTNWRIDSKTKLSLAKKVAMDLIRTIRTTETLENQITTPE